MKVTNGVLSDVNEKDLKLLEKNPDKFWNGVKVIGVKAFSYLQNLKEITIPSQVYEIQSSAFWACRNLNVVDMGDDVYKIGDCAFKRCEKLNSINLSNELESIGNECFADCKKLKSINLPNSVTNIQERAFANTGIEFIKIPERVMEIKQSTFSNCKNLKTVDLNNVKRIGICAFNNASFLREIDLSKITEIGAFAFNDCNIDKVDISKCNKIDIYAFKDCPIKYINMSKNLKVIGDNAFKNCYLKQIILPSNIEKFGKNVFIGCDFVRNIQIEVDGETYEVPKTFFDALNTKENSLSYIRKFAKEKQFVNFEIFLDVFKVEDEKIKEVIKYGMKIGLFEKDEVKIKIDDKEISANKYAFEVLKSVYNEFNVFEDNYEDAYDINEDEDEYQQSCIEEDREEQIM